MVLQSIRERLTGILAFVILGILVVPFALVGVNQYFTSSGENVVARVNDQEITTNEFNQSYSDYRRRMQSVLGAAYDPEAYDQLVMRRRHLESLIERELVTQAVQSMGLDVDDETLAAEIREIPAFQVDGQFNVDVYQGRLAAQGLSPKQFQNEMRSQFVINQLPRNLAVSSIATRLELNDIVALFEQTRSFGAVLVPAEVPQPPPAFEESEITRWYESHQADYQTEEKVVIEYVELDAAALPAGPPPDEDYLRQQFEAQKGRFISPEQRHVAHILIEVGADASDVDTETARQAAEDLAKRARAGEDFAALAREFSGDQGSAAGGGDLGWIEPGVMVKAFEDATYDLSMASPVSEPVQTAFGWHVIKLLELRESTGMSFEEAQTTLLQEYEQEQASRLFLEQADRLVDLVYEDPTTLESAALVMGLPVQVEGPFSRAGGEGVAANPGVVAAAFSDLVLLQGSVSDPVNLDENRLVMIRLKQHLPVALRALEEVRDDIVARLAEELAREQARQRADELLAALRGGAGGLETLAAEAGLAYSFHEAVKRNAVEPDALLVGEIFRLQAPAEGEVAEAVLSASDGFAVVVLQSVVDGKLDDESPRARQQYERVVANSRASLETDALMQQLRSRAEIEVYENRL